MAVCEKRPKSVEPPPVEYVLTLSEYEARELKRALSECVSWGAFPVARHVSEAIREVLS